MGGWLSGLIYDWTGSYTAALVKGIGWNLANMVIVCWLLLRKHRRAVGVLADASRRNTV
jgi:hypothetical protein